MIDTKTGPSRGRHDDVFPEIAELDKIAISVKSHKLLELPLTENPDLEKIMRGSNNEVEALEGVKFWIMSIIEDKPEVLKFFKNKHEGRKTFESLGWRDYASIRLLDYIENAGREFEDLNLKGEVAISNPIKMIWLPTQFGVGGAKPYFFEDMIYLFKQLSGKIERKLPTREQVEKWMERWPSGLDPRIIKLREENKERILNIIIDRMDKGEISSRSFKFGPDMTREEKYSLPPLKRITVAFSSVYFSSLAAIMTAWLRGVAFGVDGVNDFHKLFRYHLDTGMSD